MLTSSGQPEIEDEAFAAAVKYIAYRPRTEQETRAKLLKRYTNNIIEPVITRCYRNGLPNDQQFSELWVESRINSKPKSALMIKKELMSKGVSEQISKTAIELVDDSENALISAQKKVRSINHLPKDKFARKLMSHLLRKGFDHHTVKTTTNTVWLELNNQQ